MVGPDPEDPITQDAEAKLREAFFRDHAGGRTNVFLDLLFVKG